jgi:hypothetical protein
MRIMHDSITAADIPRDARMVAGYINGTWVWSAADWARFPNATKVRIATRANVNDGHVLDVEPGDATPAQAPAWVKMRRAAGVDPTVYCNLSALPAVQAAFTAAGVAQPHYWVARYDNVATVPAGVVAKQYINDPASGGHYDLSAVADYWPGVDPAPAPAPTVNPLPVEDTVKDLPAGQHMFVRLFAAGRPHFLWWEINDNAPDGTPHQGVIEDIAYIRRTPTTPDADYAPLGQPGYPDLRGATFHKDRSGPITFADDVAWIRLIVSCDGESSMAIG